MPYCSSCKTDHEDVLSGESLKALAGYDAEVTAVVDRVLAGALSDDPRENRSLKVSLLNTLAARIIGQGAVLALEVIEEDEPTMTSRQQLSAAFSVVTSDVVHRLTGVFANYADKGELPSVSKFVAEDEARSATHH